MRSQREYRHISSGHAYCPAETQEVQILRDVATQL